MPVGRPVENKVTTAWSFSPKLRIALELKTMRTLLASFGAAVVFLAIVTSLVYLVQDANQLGLGAPEIEALLPRDGAEVDVMEIVFPDRYMELLKPFQEATEKNRDWFQSHLRGATPGEPLEYDARLGLTKDEYEEFLDLSGKATLRKSKTAKLSVSRHGSRIVLNGGEELPALKDIVLDLDRNTVTTPFGDAKFSHHFESRNTVTGPWNGLAWRLEDSDKRAVLQEQVIRFDLGRLLTTGQGILRYDVAYKEEQSRQRIVYILLYAL
jgi:hypothetical protein